MSCLQELTCTAQEPTYVPNLLDVLLPYEEMLVEGAGPGLAVGKLTNISVIADYCYAPTIMNVAAYMASSTSVSQ